MADLQEAIRVSLLGTETVGCRVQADRDGFWYLGTVVDQPAPLAGTSDKWTVQCDADSHGTVYHADRVRVWSSSSVGLPFAGNPDYHYPDARYSKHDLPTAMAMVARNVTLLGFNVELGPGSLVEYRAPASATSAQSWRKAAIDSIDGAARQFVLVSHDADSFGETVRVSPEAVRCDLDDREGVHRVMFVRRGAGKVSRIPAPAPAGWWVSVQWSSPLLPASSSELLFSDGWSGDHARCRIVDRHTGPGNTRATGEQFTVHWKRPGRGQGLADGLKGLSLFRSVLGSDVEQGEVGDCWFMGAVAAVAHSAPHLIRRLFVQQELCASGRYDVRLWSLKEGRWVTHTIDDRLPVLDYHSPSGLNLAYAKISADDELWPCLLEKAMAKHMGGYSAMDGGTSTFALGTLLGCPRDKLVAAFHCSNGDWNLWKMRWSDDHASDPEYYDDQSLPPEELLDFLTHSSEFLMCAGTPGAAENPRDVGLSGGHVYSILEVRRDVAGMRGLHMVRMRDPCSYGLGSGYTGPWSLGGCSVGPSKLWGENPEVRRALLHDPDSPETEYDEPWASFWIPYSDFCRFFGGVYVAAHKHAPGPDDTSGHSANEGRADVGARVHIQREDVWWQGSIVGPADEESSWVVQCDGDEPGVVTVTKELLTWVEPGNGSSFWVAEGSDYDVVYERGRHDIPTAMAMVLRSSETVGFNLQFEVGSRVECEYKDRGWVKAEIVALPVTGRSFRVRGIDGGDVTGSFDVYTSNIRYDMSDTETVWNTVIVRKGARLTNAGSSASGGGVWTCLMPKSGPLWNSFFSKEQ